MTACVFLTVACIAGSIGWIANDAAVQRTAGEQKTRDTLQEAKEYRDQKDWARAADATRRAAEMLASYGGSAQMQREVEQLRADLQIVQKLEEARVVLAVAWPNRSENFDYPREESGYAAAFSDYGVPVLRLEPGEAAALIRASVVVEELVPALDSWARSTRNPADRDKLLTVARLADDDALRQQIRDAVANGDNAVLLRLARDPQIEEQSAVTQELLGESVSEVDLAAAADFLCMAQQRYPTDLRIIYLFGRVLLDMKPPRAEEASGLFRAALALRPRSPTLHLSLGLSLQQQKKLAAAIAEYRTALRLDPDFALAHNNLGHLFSQDQHDYQSALGEFREAVRCWPDFAAAQHNLGWAYVHLGQWAQGLEQYSKALELLPEGWRATDARGHRCYAYTVVGQWDHAAADLVPQGIDAAPLDDTWFQLACLQVLKGDTSGYQRLCKQWLERIVNMKTTLAGDDAFRSSRTCMLHTAAGNDPAKGVSWAEAAVSTNPKCEWYLHCLALAHYRAGQLEEAIKWCNNSLKADPGWGGNGQNWLLLGLAHKQLGHTQEAGEWLNQATRWREGAVTGKREPGILYPPEISLSDWLEFQVLYREAEMLFGRDVLKPTTEQQREIQLATDAVAISRTQSGRWVLPPNKS